MPEHRLRKTRQAYGPSDDWRAIRFADFRCGRGELKQAEVSVRVYNCLRNLKGLFLGEPLALTMGEVDAISDRQLLQMKNFGKKSLLELRSLIAAAKAAEAVTPVTYGEATSAVPPA